MKSTGGAEREEKVRFRPEKVSMAFLSRDRPMQDIDINTHTHTHACTQTDRHEDDSLPPANPPTLSPPEARKSK